MEFKNRKPQNENRVLITPEDSSPFYATVQREDNPESGNEGTPIEAGIFEEFNQKVEKSMQVSSEALANSTSAINMVENLSVSCTEVEETAKPQVEIKTNAENNHKDIHFILPASKQGKSYRNKGAWNNLELYVNNELYIDTVSFNGCTYYCKATNTNQQPEDNTENEYWGLLATRGSNANVTIVDNLESDNASYALSAKQGNIINGKINNVEANLTQVSGTLNQNITQVKSELESEISANSATINNLDNKVSSILSLVYPIDSIYMSVNSVNPSILFGGTWERIEDKFLLAAGSNYAAGTTGGEASHTLTIAEMPSHTHEQQAHSHDQDSHAHSISPNGCHGLNGNSTWHRYSDGNTQSNGLAMDTGSAKPKIHDNVAINYNTGGGGAHNNMPPYLTVYIWKRVG